MAALFLNACELASASLFSSRDPHGALAGVVESSGQDVGFNLAIPQVGDMVAA